MKRILASLIISTAFVILISLGFWQLQRKQWKETLIANLNRNAQIAPIALSVARNPINEQFRRIFATGVYLNDKEIQVYGLLDVGNGQALQGGYLFTPFRLADGAIVMVNRGFVPKGETSIARINGVTRIEGILRNPEMRGWFVPENTPAKGQWFTRDSEAMATALDLTDALPFYIEADALAGTAWPKGGTIRSALLRNDHLQYAITWFSLAFVLLGATSFSLLRNRHRLFARH